jgi:glutamate-ammonia-ligase adenylyltransferase
VPLRLERYFSQVRKRPGLVKLFHTTGSWVADFCRGLVQSELLSELLAHNPSLVEGLASRSERCADSQSWEDSCRSLLDHAQDYEGGLEWLRRLKNERLLQLALGDLRGEFDAHTLESRLSALADFVIRETYERIRTNVRLRADLPLCILGLGKLGSREMSYLSDLDLVFVYEPGPGESEEHIPSDVIRLIQRFMRMLSTPLHEGPGYAVDARLRPTGNYGPLIVTRRSWFDYYSRKADLWEIQALLRVRGITGHLELGRWIEAAAQEICYAKRSSSDVRERICHLRRRMQRERADERGDIIDIKLGMGGLTDLEFLVQGHLLIEGYRDPSLRSPSVRSALEIVLQDIPELKDSAQEILVSFQSLRYFEHRLRLHTNQTASRINPGQFEAMQAMGLWPPAYGRNQIEDWQDLLKLRRRVRSALNYLCPEL